MAWTTSWLTGVQRKQVFAVKFMQYMVQQRHPLCGSAGQHWRDVHNFHTDTEGHD